MLVAKNCLKQIHKNFDLIHLNNIIEKNVYPNVYKLLQVALTLPISSATCERSFSALRKIKTWLRVSMGQDRLTDLSILYIEKDLTKLINVNKVIDAFAEKDRRINLV
ncbi:zinc finger MYM-type protein 1-like [Melanaphis sacchari]|uniref:zinc finger MYM-type protein 1-like n=1 Tax=Melanaphis sacchari TaxID=742174 RepID=UPI000DC1314C|nr:zinc finger MYM-type protein 1-like [Melanaphis sacchari]